VKYRKSNNVNIRVFQKGTVLRLQRVFAVIAVEDNGPGIPEEYHKSVFQMFSRGTHEFEEGSRQTQGLGVGLTAVKRIVEQHYGEVSIDPTYTEGLRIVFSLPIEPVELFR
jgi:signal transduction histidine kinase